MSEKKDDLGLDYPSACHAMQTGVAYEMGLPERQAATEPKHLRVGINSAMVDHAAMVRLLIEKGIITLAEYEEAVRLEMNREVLRYEALHPRMTFR